MDVSKLGIFGFLVGAVVALIFYISGFFDFLPPALRYAALALVAVGVAFVLYNAK